MFYILNFTTEIEAGGVADEPGVGSPAHDPDESGNADGAAPGEAEEAVEERARRREQVPQSGAESSVSICNKYLNQEGSVSI